MRATSLANQSTRGHITRRVVLVATALFIVVAGGAAGAAALDATRLGATTCPAATTTTSTLLPSTTTAPAPTTTSTMLAPVATEPPVTEPSPPVDDPIAQAEAALAAVVPASWRSAVPVQFVAVAGSVSHSHIGGFIQVGTGHLDGPLPRLQFVLAHEFGHQLAYRFGTGAYLGAAPAGFPAAGAHPEEYWADCVATAFTGAPLDGHGCAPDALAFTSSWLAAGPPG